MDANAAASCFERSAKIQEMELGKYHFDTVKTYHRLGRAQWLCRQPVLAMLSWKRSVRLSINHSTTVLEDEPSAGNMFVMEETVVANDIADGPSCCIDKKDVPPHVLLWKDVLQFIQQNPMDIYFPTTRSGEEKEEEGVEVVSSSKDSMLQVSLKAIWEALQYERRGNVSFKQQRYSQALEQYEMALKLEQDTIRKMSVSVGKSSSSPSSTSRVIGMTLDEADITCKIAQVHRLQDDYETSLEYYVRAHEIYQTWLGKDHPATRGALAQVRLVSQDNTFKEASFSTKRSKKGKEKGDNGTSLSCWGSIVPTSNKQKKRHAK